MPISKKPIILNPAPGIAFELLKNGKGYFVSKKIDSHSLCEQIKKFTESNITYSNSPNIQLASFEKSIK